MMRFKHPQKVPGSWDAARRSPTHSCRSASTATSPSSRLGRPCSKKRTGPRARRRSRLRRGALRGLRGLRGAHPAARRGRCSRRPGSTGPDGSAPPDGDRSATHHRLLGDGPHPARHAVRQSAEIVNFLLLRGMIGKPGAGVCPVRGHSNVQGDRTMGIWEKMPETFLDRLDGSSASSRRASTAWTRSTRSGPCATGGRGSSSAWAATSSPRRPTPPVTAAALRRCSLTVHVSTKLNRGHLVTGGTALILPSLGRTESDVQDGERSSSVEDSMGDGARRRAAACPAERAAASEVAIVARSRARCGAVPGAVGAVHRRLRPIRDPIAGVVPGCEDYNARSAPGGSCCAPGPRRSRDSPPHRQSHSPSTRCSGYRCPRAADVQTIRSHDQYNTTIYGLDDRYRGVKGGRRWCSSTPTTSSPWE